MHSERADYIEIICDRLEAALKIQRWVRGVLQRIRFNNAIGRIRTHIDVIVNPQPPKIEKAKKAKKKIRRSRQEDLQYINS